MSAARCPPPSRRRDLPALFIESPALYAYLQMRVEIIATLVQEMRDIATGYGTKMEVMPAAWGQPAARAWREGVALRRLAEVSDALLPLCYSADPKEVLSDLRWVKMLSSGARFSVGMSAGHPIATSAENLAAKAAVCQDEGAEGVYYYNYGMLTEGAPGLGGPRQSAKLTVEQSSDCAAIAKAGFLARLFSFISQLGEVHLGGDRVPVIPTDAALVQPVRIEPPGAVAARPQRRIPDPLFQRRKPVRDLGIGDGDLLRREGRALRIKNEMK